MGPWETTGFVSDLDWAEADKNQQTLGLYSSPSSLKDTGPSPDAMPRLPRRGRLLRSLALVETFESRGKEAMIGFRNTVPVPITDPFY